MALSVDTTSHATATGAGGSTLTWAHTCAASADKLVVIACGADGGAGRDVSGVTYNGVALTKLAEQDDGGFENVEIWRLNSPATGSALNIVVTFGAVGGQQTGGAISFIGSDTAEGTPTGSTNTTANPSMSVASAAGDLCVGGYSSDLGSDGLTVADQTLIFNDHDVAGDSDFNAQYATAAGASTTVSWTAPPVGAGSWAITGIAIKAAGAGGDTLLGQACL